MSTRCRIIMTYNNRFLCSGSIAVRELLCRVYPTSLNLKGKLKLFAGSLKQEKLEQVAEKLPLGFALILIQEPRGTRKNRSLYWKYRANQNVPKQAAQHAGEIG